MLTLLYRKCKHFVAVRLIQRFQYNFLRVYLSKNTNVMGNNLNKVARCYYGTDNYKLHTFRVFNSFSLC